MGCAVAASANLVLRDADPSWPAPQDEGIIILSGWVKIPALRCAAAGMTGVEWRDAGLRFTAQSAALRHVPGKVQRSGTLSGIQRNERRAAAHYCLKTEWKRASRGIHALDPGHPSACAAGFRGRAASGTSGPASASLRPARPCDLGGRTREGGI